MVGCDYDGLQFAGTLMRKTMISIWTLAGKSPSRPGPSGNCRTAIGRRPTNGMLHCGGCWHTHTQTQAHTPRTPYTHTHAHTRISHPSAIPSPPPPLPDGCRFFFSFVSLFFPVFFLRPLFFSAALSFHWGAPAINRCQNRSAAHPLPNPRSPPTRPPSFVHPLSSRFTRCRLFFYAFPSLCGTVRTIWKKYWKLHFYQAFEFLVWILNFLFHFNVLLHFILDI